MTPATKIEKSALPSPSTSPETMEFPDETAARNSPATPWNTEYTNEAEGLVAAHDGVGIDVQQIDHIGALAEVPDLVAQVIGR